MCKCKRLPEREYRKFHPRRRCRLAVSKTRVTWRSHPEPGEAR